jgi:hypothetical protein
VAVAQVLWDDVTLTLMLWEMAVRLRAVPVSGRPVTIDNANSGELTGRKGRFAARADWAEQAADLVLAYPVERDSQFMLREGSTLARGALLSRAEYAFLPWTSRSRTPRCAARHVLAAGRGGLRLCGPGAGPRDRHAQHHCLVDAHRLLWANFGQSKMPGLAERSLATDLGSARLLVTHGQRSTGTAITILVGAVVTNRSGSGNHRFMSHRSATSPKSVLSVGDIDNHLMHEPMAYPGMPLARPLACPRAGQCL